MNRRVLLATAAALAAVLAIALLRSDVPMPRTVARVELPTAALPSAEAERKQPRAVNVPLRDGDMVWTSKRRSTSAPSGSDELELVRLGRDEVLKLRDDVIGFNSKAYGASLDRRSVAVATPYAIKGLGRPRLAWSFEEARVGEVVVARAAEISPKLEDRSIVYARGGVEERYLIRPEGLEQIFVLTKLPSKGPITVSGRIKTNLEAPTHGGDKLSFTHKGADVLSISKAVAIDGAGRREPLELAYADGRVSMTIPAGWVAKATLPITIDPLIGGTITIDRRLNDSITAVQGLEVRATDVAYSPSQTGYLVVWDEAFGASEFNFDVLGQRIGATGQLLGNPIAIGTSAAGDYEPTVCWASGVDRYLVAWRQDPNDNGWEGDQRIQARVIAGDGSFVTGEFALDDTTGQDFGPSAAFDGARWYVTWTQGGPDFNARGRFVDAAGLPANEASPDVEVDFAARPTAAFVDGGYVVAWEKEPAGGAVGIVARTMDAAGNFTSAVTAVSQASGAARHADVTAGLGKALIAWHQKGLDDSWDIRGRIATGSLGFQGGAFAINEQFNHQVTPRGAFSQANDEWFVAYTDPVAGRADVYANRVSSAGSVLPAERLSKDGQADIRPELAANSGANEMLVVFLHRAEGPFQLRGRRVAMGAGAPSTPGTPVGVPNPNGTGSHVVSWDPSVGSGLTYELERSSDGGGSFATIASPAAPSFTEPGIPEGSYIYRVRAKNAGGTYSAYSGASDPVVVDKTAPPSPATLGQFRSDGLTAIPVGGTTSEFGVILKGALSDAATRIRLEVEVKDVATPFDGAGLVASGFVETGETASVVVSPLSTGSYRWRARSVDEAGNAGAFATFGDNLDSAADFIVGSGTPPSAPANLTAEPGNARVTLAWEASAGADSYTIKRGTSTGGPYAPIASGLTSTSYVDLTASNGTTWFYVVTALNSAGESAPSNEASATPVAPPLTPTGLAAEQGNNQVTLTWDASAGAASYTVKRATGASGPFEALAEGVAETSYTDRTALNGTTYSYVVSALNLGGESPDSSAVSSTPVAPPPAPALTAEAGDAAVTLSWTPSAGATSYSVYRSTSTGGPYAMLLSGITGTSHVDTSLANGTPYFYVVTASNAGGESAFSNEATATPTGAPLAAPVITTASQTTNDTTPTIDGTSDAGVTITVFFTQGASTVETLATMSSPAGMWSVTAAPKANGTYGVFARASNGTSTSPSSNLIAITVDATGPQLSLVTSTTLDGAYGAGRSINVILSFSELVRLVGGRIFVTLDTGATIEFAPFEGTFASGVYLVSSGENTSDLTVAGSILLESGATLRDVAGNDASLAIPAGGNLGDNKDLVIDTVPPALASVDSSSPDRAYGTSQNVDITVTFNEPVTLQGGSLLVSLDTGATVPIQWSGAAMSASGVYTVAEGQNSPDLTALSPLTLPGGVFVSDLAGNAALLDIPPGGNLHELRDILIDTIAPAVANVTSASDDRTYGAGEAIDITVNFSEPVTLHPGGTLRIPLNTGVTVTIGAFGPSMSASTTYVVASGHNTPDLAVSSALTLGPGSSLTDGAGNAVSLDIPPGQNLGDLKNITVSGGVSTAPLPPTNVRTTVYNNLIDVEWDVSPSAGVAGYRVYRKVGAGAWTLLNPGGVILNTKYRDAAVVNGTRYDYRITAVRN